MSGAVCFYGTRIPVRYMLDYLQDGESVEQFCNDYGVPVAQAHQVVELMVQGFELLLSQAA